MSDEGAGNWRKCLSTDEKAALFIAKYDDTKATMQGVFDQTVKIIQEMQSRVEREMFRGYAHKSADDTAHILHDPALVKDLVSIGKVVSSLATVGLRITKAGIESAEGMSIEEQMRLCVNFILELPQTYQRTIIDELNEKIGPAVDDKVSDS